MGDAHVHSRTCGYVSAFAALFFLIGAEQASVMSLLDYDERYSRLVVRFEFDARFSDGRQLVLE